MKSFGIVRELDELGRIVIPIEQRRMLQVEIGDPLHFFIDEQSKTLAASKYGSPCCVFCFGIQNIQSFKGRLICEDCWTGVLQAPKVEPTSVAVEVVDTPHSKTVSIKKRQSTNTSLLLLQEHIQAYPSMTQTQRAAALQLSQGRVSQLMKQINRDL